MEKFGELVRKARKRARRTLGDAARLLGVSVVYVSEVELGKRPPFSVDRIKMLAEFYKEDTDPLLEAACRERGYLEVDMSSASDSQLKVVSGLARGELTEEQWEKIQEIIERPTRPSTGEDR